MKKKNFDKKARPEYIDIDDQCHGVDEEKKHLYQDVIKENVFCFIKNKIELVLLAHQDVFESFLSEKIEGLKRQC